MKRIFILVLAVLSVLVCCRASVMLQDSTFIVESDTMNVRRNLLQRIIKY